jgi:hypothetical protein
MDMCFPLCEAQPTASTELQGNFPNSVLSAKGWFKASRQDFGPCEISRSYRSSAAKRWFKTGHWFVQVTVVNRLARHR